MKGIIDLILAFAFWGNCEVLKRRCSLDSWLPEPGNNK